MTHLKEKKIMRGRLASRAHSFKENFLNVFGAASNPQAQNNEDQIDKPAMSKKTNSTDNIIDFVTTSSNTVADPRSTDVMVREVQLSLRYFQDAVIKGTYELLPGCATVVLETVLALQSYAVSRRDPRQNVESTNPARLQINQSTKSMCCAVAKLTQWADRVITDGCVDPSEDYVNQVIEPVRLAVNNLAANLLAISVVPKSTSFHNSLPDLASPERESKQQPLSYVDSRPPPLPPKSKSQSENDDPLVMAEVDWFSNPLFESSDQHRRSSRHHCRTRSSKKRSSRAYSESNEQIPDFCQPQRMSVCEQTNVSYINVAPSTDFDSPRKTDPDSSSTSSDIPPALPRKNRPTNRKVSTYDNVYLPNNLATFKIDDNLATPPPLPPKKKHIMSYMEMFGRSLVTTDEELVQSLTRTKDLLEAVWQQNYHDYSYNSPIQSNQYDFKIHHRNEFSGMGVKPIRMSMSSYQLPPPELPPPPPPPLLVASQGPSTPGMPPPFPNLPDDADEDGDLDDDDDDIYPPALPPKRGPLSSARSPWCPHDERIIPIVIEGRGKVSSNNRFSDSMTSSTSSSGFGTDIQSLPRHSLPSPVVESSQDKSKPSKASPVSAKAKRSSSKKKKNLSDTAVLDQIDVRKACLDMLVYTSSENGGKELLRAGSVDALIVLATQSVKNDFLYQEAFIATYRTFVSTHDLLEKLVQRFRKFNNRRDAENKTQMIYKRVAHCAFSLMVRVVDGLADCDFQDNSVMELLSDFIAELVNDAELILARALRTKFIQKYEDRKLRLLPDLDTSGLSLGNKNNLLSFKSTELAEQMTLLDAQLFLRLDSAELILWVQEQNEDKSPNLTKFTEHFNNMSFWCRTKILQQEDAKEREKLVSKFIKIMKELRKHNNFNSYLALLSALDSAPIRRLEWCKSITEALKEHCALIDSSSSFRAYRQALSSAV